MTFDELLRHKHPTAWIEFERGELTPDEYYRRMFSDRRPVDGAAFEGAIREAYVWMEGAEALLHELAHASLEMHAFSNYPIWYAMLDEKLGLSRYLEWTFVSCKTGLRKPAPESYTHAIETLQRPAEHLLFVDDRETNCLAARSAGIRAIKFDCASSLRAALRQRGIL